MAYWIAVAATVVLVVTVSCLAIWRGRPRSTSVRPWPRATGEYISPSPFQPSVGNPSSSSAHPQSSTVNELAGLQADLALNESIQAFTESVEAFSRSIQPQLRRRNSRIFSRISEIGDRRSSLSHSLSNTADATQADTSKHTVSPSNSQTASLSIAGVEQETAARDQPSASILNANLTSGNEPSRGLFDRQRLQPRASAATHDPADREHLGKEERRKKIREELRRDHAHTESLRLQREAKERLSKSIPDANPTADTEPSRGISDHQRIQPQASASIERHRGMKTIVSSDGYVEAKWQAQTPSRSASHIRGTSPQALAAAPTRPATDTRRRPLLTAAQADARRAARWQAFADAVAKEQEDKKAKAQ
jgi:hypothetical protein